MTWKKGESGNPAGKPLGARTRLSNSFLRMMAAHWEEYGESAIRRVHEKDPATYVKVIASLLPKEVALTADKDLQAVLQAIDGHTKGLPVDIQEDDISEGSKLTH